MNKNETVLTNSSLLVECKGMQFYRGDRPIFKSLDLVIKRGKITAIMGPSGTGKTTLLHLIGGLLTPSAGTLSVLDQPTKNLSNSGWLNLRKRMGMLFQSGALFIDLNVFDNVAYPLREHTKLSESMIRDIVKMKLEAVGLRGSEHLMPSELSGGMSRRAALARAIALDPEMMMYDEPFTGQDPISMGVLLKLIKTLNDVLGLTSIIVSHDVHEVLNIADEVYIISNAEVIGYGTPESIRKNTSPMVKQFIHGEADGPVAFRYPAPPLMQDFLGESNA